ncbi:hypothetical protein HZB88_02590 [archaeon]|nr:hypothetical protein [archaeon]
MLISEKLNTIIRILLTNTFGNKPDLTVPELAKEAKLTSGMAKRLLVRLEKSGYLIIKRSIKLTNHLKLMKAWGYTYSLREIEHSEFISAERPQYIILKIANWARKKKMHYAFTLFSATEHISPYVAPSTTHIYILKSDLQKWQNFFRTEKILPAEKEGNVVCLLVNDDYFKNIEEIRGANIVSLPQLYADLMSYGGRGEEAAQELSRIIDKRLKNV